MASSRRQAHRARSPSPQPGPSSTSFVASPSTTSLSIKGRSAASSAPSTTPGAANKLLHSAVANAATSAAAAAASTPRATPGGLAKKANLDEPDSASRAQFEGQEDYISFSFSPSPSPPPSAGGRRGTPRDGGGRGGKRKRGDRDDKDEPDEEGTRRLRNREKGRSTPWVEEPGVEWKKCETAIEMLNAETRAFVSYISPTPVEHELRLWTIELIRRTIKSKYADADVQCFGSVGTGLYLPGGDIDLVVLCPSMPSPPLKPSSSLLHRLASLLLTSSIALPSSLVVIAKARVPIVKFTTRFGGFAVDLSVNQKNGVEAAVRVRGMLEDFAFREEGYVEPGQQTGGGSASSSRSATPAVTVSGKNASKKGKGKGKANDPDSSAEEGEEEDASSEVKAVQHPVDYGVARSLVLLVKAFLAQRGMNEVFTGGLGSYSIICLVISFLQLHPRIQTSHLNPNRNLGLLFVEFLELYGKHFNYDEAGITLRGRGGYYNKHDKGWFRQQQPYLLSIEDPNDPQNDVSGGSHAIIRVRQTFAGGFDTLTATLLHRHSLLSSSSRHSSSSVTPLSGASLPNADSDAPSRKTQSLLGSIIGMTAAGVEARQANFRLHRDGVLQKLLRRSDPDKGGKKGGAAEGLLGEKQQKKLRKEEREREKRERTIARLERRQEEKEIKRERRERKRRERVEGKMEVEEVEAEVVVRPMVGEQAIEDAKAKAASLEGLAPDHEDDEEGGDGMDFVVDTVGSRPSAFPPRPSAPSAAAKNEEEEDSRYSLGVPALSRPSHSASSSRAPTYTSGASSDSDATSNGAENDEDEEGDGDVVLGGTGGDFVRVDSVAPAPARSSSSPSSSSSGSEEEVVETLVPAAKRARTPGGGGGSGGAKERADKKAKMAARIAFWGKKGLRED
ncbi:hypothetical protein JCM8547_008458 [Rhodosporidiobolus lusitaniae]